MINDRREENSWVFFIVHMGKHITDILYFINPPFFCASYLVVLFGYILESVEQVVNQRSGLVLIWIIIPHSIGGLFDLIIEVISIVP
jgi:hypothetical protein